MIGNDVVAASNQTLIDAGEEGVRLGWAQNALQRGAADLSYTLCATLQDEWQQSAHNLCGIQLLSAKRRRMHPYSLKITSEQLKYCLLRDKYLHNQVTSEADQREQNVFKRRGKRQGLTTQSPKVSCLDGTDVALWWNGIIGKCISLKKEEKSRIFEMIVLF